MKIEYTALTDQGKIRHENQDSVCIPNSYINSDKYEHYESIDYNEALSFAVFDGMGGELYGREASIIAAETFSSNISATPLHDIIMLINTKICEFMNKNDVLRMGTTAAAVKISEKELEYCNIGDSRIYIIQKYNMFRLSVDHVIKTHVGKRTLSQHLGIYPNEMLIEPHHGKFPISGDFSVLICSDGLTDLIPETEIGKTIITECNKEAALSLKEKAMHLGGNDNVSIILIHVNNECEEKT